VLVEATKLTKRLGGRVIVDDVSLSLDRGQALVIMGPSGSGKTTLLRCLNGLDRADGGQVRIGAHTLDPDSSAAATAALRRQVGFLFQQWNLFQHLTVLENVIEAPVHVAKLSREDAVARAQPLLDRFGLAGHAHAYPRRLSGGEQQRTAIARALAMQPSLLLLDEPTSALDRPRATELLALLSSLQSTGLALILVTHDPHVAESLHCQAAELKEGRLTYR
jgi:ABC-type polar amino acid transport system ATPase subunit